MWLFKIVYFLRVLYWSLQFEVGGPSFKGIQLSTKDPDEYDFLEYITRHLVPKNLSPGSWYPKSLRASKQIHRYIDNMHILLVNQLFY